MRPLTGCTLVGLECGLAGYGGLWRAMAGYGGLWRAMAGYGGLWQADSSPECTAAQAVFYALASPRWTSYGALVTGSASLELVRSEEGTRDRM